LWQIDSVHVHSRISLPVQQLYFMNPGYGIFVDFEEQEVLMDIDFEHDMQRFLHAHMEDASNHFVKHKGYPVRAFIYNGYEFTPYRIDSDRMEEEMKNI